MGVYHKRAKSPIHAEPKHEEQRTAIFDPFTQGDSSYQKRFQGSGLGLSIVKRLVELMAGKITIKSTLGKGTTIEVEVEVGREQGGLRTPALAAEVVHAETGRPLHILLVEDNTINTKLAMKMLTQHGHSVTAAVNGQEALEHLAAKRFDLVLMDIQMPVMDGIEAFKRLRNGEAGALNIETPVVAMTAYTMEEEKEEFRTVGMDGYIEKPYQWDKIYEVIQELLY